MQQSCLCGIFLVITLLLSHPSRQRFYPPATFWISRGHSYRRLFSHPDTGVHFYHSYTVRNQETAGTKIILYWTFPPGP